MGCAFPVYGYDHRFLQWADVPGHPSAHPIGKIQKFPYPPGLFGQTGQNDDQDRLCWMSTTPQGEKESAIETNFSVRRQTKSLPYSHAFVLKSLYFGT